MKGKEMVKLYQKHGWSIDRINGSHYIMKKDGAVEVIPVHNSDIPTGLQNKLLKRLGLK